MTTVVVVGGGIAGLAAAHRLEALLPGVEITLVERSERVGGSIVTEYEDGYVVEGAADSFLSRKPRGIGLCEELGLADQLIGRRPEHARSFVRLDTALHPLPEGLTGLIPTDLDALAASELLSPEARARLAAERELAPAPPGPDESIASFVSRRVGPEAYERLVEPLMTGIYGGDGEQLSLAATFPNLRSLELEHGSVLAGLSAQTGAPGPYPPFVSPRAGMGELVRAVAASLERTTFLVGAAAAVSRSGAGFVVALGDGRTLDADAVVLAVPAHATADLVAELDRDLADLHAEIPYASSAVVTLGHAAGSDAWSPDGYGYVVPRAAGTDALACTWTSNKWEGRAPPGHVLARV
jgi:oxygen-dependent protoporphyrinogen oxidase